MTNSVLWRKPSITCFGDRLLDTMILSAFARLHDADLYLSWGDCPFVVGSQGTPTYSPESGVSKEWDAVRFVDYKVENFTQYFNLPKNIRINEEITNPTHTFDNGLGGSVSPDLFHDLYLSGAYSLSDFKKAFNETLSEFTPTEKLLSLVRDIPAPDVSVHLRRTDKIQVLGDGMTFLTKDSLNPLNTLTETIINRLNDGSKKFYFCSDDVLELERYHSLYPDHIKHDFKYTDMEKTYIDMYMLSMSKQIVLSQKHSNFSVFASYIHGAQLIYLYKDCLINSQGFNRSENFVYYETLL
jgi:hypothetical protein